MGIGQILFQVDENGVHYRRKLKSITRTQFAELIVAIDIELQELKIKYKKNIKIEHN